MLVQAKRNKRAALKLMRKLLRKYGFVPDKLVTDDLRSYGRPRPVISGSQNATSAVNGATTEPRIRINRPADENARCKGSRARVQPKDFSQPTQPPTTLSTSSAISPQQEPTEPSGPRRCRRGAKSSLRREPDVPADLLRALFGNVTVPPARSLIR